MESIVSTIEMWCIESIRFHWPICLWKFIRPDATHSDGIYLRWWVKKGNIDFHRNNGWFIQRVKSRVESKEQTQSSIRWIEWRIRSKFISSKMQNTDSDLLTSVTRWLSAVDSVELTRLFTKHKAPQTSISAKTSVNWDGRVIERRVATFIRRRCCN